jgi:glyoxylase-like metal-dependent hydrolase (beta-lactamase superfamily II)
MENSMFKKILKAVGMALVLAAVCVGGFLGWFKYQMRDMRPAATAKISDTLFVVKGDIGDMYLVACKDGYIAFDAADNPKLVTEQCKTLSIDPAKVRAVFLTHSDGDHVNGLPAFHNAKVYISADEVPLLKSKKYRHFMGLEHINKLPVTEYTTLKDGESVTIGDVIVNAIATPGHTLGSMCFKVDGALFTGDLCIIVNGRVREMLKVFTEDMATDRASIKKIAAIGNLTGIYTAHTGYTTDVQTALAPWRETVNDKR